MQTTDINFTSQGFPTIVFSYTILRFGGICYFPPNFKRTPCKQTVKSVLGLHNLPLSHKKDARLYE